MSIKNIILIGAGGHLGPSLLTALSTTPHFTVSILARKSSQSSFPPHVKTIRIADDYPEAKLLEAFKGQDAVVSAIATANMGRQKAMIDAAVQAGVKRFVSSEFGSDTLNEKAMAILPQYLAGKRATVEYLKGKEREGLSWTAFSTGCFFELAMAGYMGFDQQANRASIFGSGNAKWSSTTLATIGLAVKNALLLPDETANKYLYIDSFTISQNQILAAFEKATDRKWTVEHVDPEAMKKEGMEKMANGDPSGSMSLIRYINGVQGHGGNYAEYQETANKLLSLPEETLEGAIEAIVKG